MATSSSNRKCETDRPLSLSLKIGINNLVFSAWEIYQYNKRNLKTKEIVGKAEKINYLKFQIIFYKLFILLRFGL